MFRCFVFLFLAACTSDSPKPVASGGASSALKTFLALGDSYTVGTAVKQEDSWPFQLSTALGIAKPRVLAQAGYTSADLVLLIDASKLNNTYDLVSLQIGVNNQYRKQDLSKFKTDLEALYQRCLSLAKSKKGIFVLSIPDWGAIPAANRDAAIIGKEIDAFNDVLRAFATTNQITFIEITAISRNVSHHPKLAADEFHFTGEMYKQWVEFMGPTVLRLLN
jgi:lysophospholipase L1-like esterase